MIRYGDTDFSNLFLRHDLAKTMSFHSPPHQARKTSLINTDGSINVRKLSRDMLEDIIVIPQTTKAIAKKIEDKPFRKDLHRRKLDAIAKRHRIQFIKSSVQERELELDNPGSQLELVADRLAQFLSAEGAQEKEQRTKQAQDLMMDRSIGTNSLLISELKTLIDFEKRQKKRRRVNASFDLMDIFKGDVLVEDEGMSKYLHIARPVLGKFNYYQRKQAIENYLIKKKKRKEFGYIRYKVRRELASKRVRCKGKFVKKPKVNLMLMAKEYNKQEKKDSFDSCMTE